MSYNFSLRATVPVALSLSVLLLFDALAMGSGQSAAAVDDPKASTEAQVTSDAAACTYGFGDVVNKADMSLHGVTLTEGGAIAVGFTRNRDSDELGRRRPATIVNGADGWTRVQTGSPGDEDGLNAVASRNGDATWAVGFTTIEGQVMPLAMRWTGNDWKVSRPQARGPFTSLFTDVAIAGDGSPVAVGYRMTASGKRLPIAARRAGGSWRNLPISTGKRESISLTGVTPDGRGGVWAVGHGGPGADIRAVIYRRDGSRWKRVQVPRLAGESVLVDAVASARNTSWAVGYRRIDGTSLPLVLRWDGKVWREADAPRFSSKDVVLTAVAASPAGGIWVVGAAWNAAISSHEAVAAWWDGQAWNEVSGSSGGTELHDVIGSLDDDGWAVGRSGQGARATRVCIPAAAGIFGGSEPAPDREPIPVEAPTADTDRSGETADADRGGETASVKTTNEATAANALLAKKTKKQKAQARAKAKAKAKATSVRKARQRAARVLPDARIDTSIVARNVTSQVGLAEQTGTYGAVVADFDADGVDDLFIGRHGRRGRLVLNRNGVFVDNPALKMPSIDRHGCTAADVDGSGLPDLYCTVGGRRGSGLKSNELWIDPGGASPSQQAVEMGISDPTGRGRAAAFLEAKDQPDTNLVVANSPVRVDGLPSIGRLYRTSGDDADFESRTRPGFAPRLGALSVQDADFDGDGREDMLLVTGGPQSPAQEGTRLYRNSRRGLVDVTRKMGIRSFGEIDSELVDLNRDGKLDLVQLSQNKIRVSILKKGRYRQVWQRNLTHGKAIASGDVNGDGKGDLYIVRSNGVRNSPDVVIVNRNGGSAWSSVVVPQVYSGSGEDAYAIDHDGNGLDDFLVLNGHNSRGPIQMTAFYAR